MNIYSFMSVGYDLLDKIWFSDAGENPRDVIEKIIPNEKCRVLDMCCGTFSNGLPIARKNSQNRVVGLDRSKAMLREARAKVKKSGLKNVKLVCTDATKTGIKSESFDYIIMGLVLHECSEELCQGLLAEAGRLLKKDGKLIVLEWDKQKSISRKIKYAPLYAMEVFVNPKYFKRFYNSDKTCFFKKYGFQMVEQHECNYSAVMELQLDAFDFMGKHVQSGSDN